MRYLTVLDQLSSPTYDTEDPNMVFVEGIDIGEQDSIPGVEVLRDDAHKSKRRTDRSIISYERDRLPILEAASNHIECESCPEAYETEKVRCLYL